MQLMKLFPIVFFTVCLTSPIYAKSQKEQPRPNNISSSSSIQNNGPSTQPKSVVKPFREIITDKAKTSKGLFIVYRIDDKVFFELPDSLLNRDLLVQSRISKAAADMRTGMSGYAGDELNSNIVRFVKDTKDKIFIQDISYAERSADSTKEMYQTVSKSNVQPIFAAFDIKAYHKDSILKTNNSVIDVTDFLNGDNEIFFFGLAKNRFKIGEYQADKSYLRGIRTFPINTEIKTIKTYLKTNPDSKGAPQVKGAAPLGYYTVELNTSILLLPKVPMQMRYYDPRVGYFSNSFLDFDVNPQGIKKLAAIARWRLEPKDEDIEKYKRGELVEPKKQIVIYIDPATPGKWVPYLIQGINDWQSAFEKAGFKNAICGKVAPTLQEDSTWSLDDARHSAIVYKPSIVENASGPHTSDPRSGEILETHINWYHNIMKLVHDWYFIQAGAIDPRARKMEFDTELMGKLIRFVSSHEVGHTLGLAHNFGSSATVPVEKLRDKKWVEENGHTPSIMDYARFNYVAQPEDHITEKGIFPRIGDYDKWAIEWGYKLIPEAKSASDETPLLNKWIVDKLKDNRYWYGGSQIEDPRCQSESLGDNAMKAGEYGIKNLKSILPHLIEWTKTPNEDYEDLKNTYNQLTGQYSRYMIHAARNIGGRYETLKTVEQDGPVYELVPATTQKEAIGFLTRNLFITPKWLLNKKILSLTGVAPTTIISSLQTTFLSKYVGAQILVNLATAEAINKEAYKLTDYLTDLKAGIWSELRTKQPIDIYRRNLQKSYITQIGLIINPPSTPVNLNEKTNDDLVTLINTDVVSLLKAHLLSLRASIKSVLTVETDAATKYHLRDIADRITEIIEQKRK